LAELGALPLGEVYCAVRARKYIAVLESVKLFYGDELFHY